MRSALKICWLLTLSLSLWSLIAHAQEPSEPSQETNKPEEPSQETGEEPASPPQVKPWQTQKAERPAAPDVFLLPDTSGKLRKVLGFRYEDFFEAWQRKENVNAVTPPRYALESLSLSGEVIETRARLRIEFEITMQAAGWIDIPIQLPELIVQQLTIEDQTQGECLVFDQQRHGHVVWLSASAAQKRKLVLEGLVKLKRSTGNYGLELHLPRATTAQFSLHVPASASRFESSPELTLTTVDPDENRGTTEVRLLGQAHPLRLSWTPAEANASNQTALVEVEGQTTIQVDPRRVLYTAKLQINSFESPLEQIQVRLPPGAKLSTGATPNEYEIQEVHSSTDPNLGQVIAIRRTRSHGEPWTLPLAAERPIEAFSSDAEDAESVVVGFEVLDAFRQSGTVTLEIDDRLQAYFDTHGDIDQVPLQKSALVSTEGRSTLGQFRYTRFPWQVVVYTSPRQRRVSVKPVYHLSLSAESAQLEVEYNYQFTGAQIFSLRMNLHGWKRTDAPIESGGLIDADGVFEKLEKRLVLPLVDSSVPQLRLSMSLHRDIQLGDQAFFLPEPLGAFVVDGELRVNSSETLQVVPKFEEMSGLSVIANAAEMPPEGSGGELREENDPIRLRTFLSQPKFVAEILQRQLQVLAAAQATVEIDQQAIRVRQQISYQAKYQPVSQLSLSLPEQLLKNDSLQVTLEGETLPFGQNTSTGEVPSGIHEEVLASEASPLETPLRQIVVSLPRPMQNDIPIEIAYEIPAPKFAEDESTPLLLPLVMPNDAVSSHEAVISASRPVLVTMNQRSTSDAWTVLPETGAANSSTTTLRLQTDEKLSFLSLYAQIDSADKGQLATLERAWIQSWITPSQRQERAVFRFRSDHATVFAQLPADFENAEIEVLLDGEAWSFGRLADNRLAVALPTNSLRHGHTLELRYQKPVTLPSWGNLPSSLPRLECRPSSAPTYWQLILPRSWLVVTSPQKLIPDYWLGWKNYRWGRQPTRSQADLEQMTGAVSGAAPTPLSTQYVYRAFELPTKIQVTVIRQVWLLMACALAAFGMGLLWLYTSLARSGAFWLGLALTLVLGIFSYPEVTLLTTQVLLAGGLMTFATGVLRHVFGADPSARYATPNFQLDPPTEVTETWQQQPPVGGTASSETTATLRTGGPSP